MAEIFQPKEAVSVRHIEADAEDRTKHAKQFREQKDHEAK